MSSSRPQVHHSSSFGNNSTASTILSAFGRRPRTATNSRDRPGQTAATGTDYANSTDELSSTNNPSRMNASSRSGLPRSSSSSQVHRVFPDSGPGNSRFAFPSSSANMASSTTTNSAPHHQSMTAHSPHVSISDAGNRPQTSGAESSNSGFPSITRTSSSQGGGNGGGAIGRYLRRYSQGAGKNMAAASEANGLDSASSTTNANGGGGVGSSSSGNSGHHHNASSLPTSQTLAVLPTPGTGGGSRSNLHDADGLASAEGATASLSLMSSTSDSFSHAATTSAGAASVVAGSNCHRIRLVPHLEATRSLHFEPIERDLVEGAIAVKIGRFTDRVNASSAAANGSVMDGSAYGGTSVVNGSSAGVAGNGGSVLSSGPSGGVPGARGGAIPSSAGGGGRVDSGRIAFKSKVVSRGHAEVWCEPGGKFFIRDTKSSSGTFLNHIRLSHPNIESKPFPVKDGDVVQLGVDYQGGTEEIYRCVKMRVELNRGWQRGANQFNVNALRQLRALQGSPMPEPGVAGKTTSTLPTNRQSMNVTDCCICLFSVTVCQALFIAPCSHVYHFKCIRPLIEQHHPGFSCPLCRTFADLDADVEEDEAWQQALLKEAGQGDSVAKTGAASTPMAEEAAPTLVQQALHTQAAAVLQATSTRDSSPSTSNSPRNPSSLRRSVQQQNDSMDEDQASTDSGQRRSLNQTSGARRGSEQHQNGSRPDTAVSSATAVPPPSFNSGTRALRNVSTPPLDLSSLRSEEREEEDEEVMYEAPLRSSAPIDIDSSHSNSTNIPHRRTPSHDGFTPSPSFLDARTPQNDHFLSTLAEAPPPSRIAIQAMEPGADAMLFPNGAFVSGRSVSSATNESSGGQSGAEGNGDVYATPGQGNSPPHKTSAFDSSVRLPPLSFDEEASGEASTSSSSAHAYTNGSLSATSKRKSPDSSLPSHLQGSIDFLSNTPRNTTNQAASATTINSYGSATSASANRTPRDTNIRASLENSERGSSSNRSQSSSRDPNLSTSGKMARFFKRTSSAVGN